ncbi:hypothetical protein G6F22_014339 [Rhizopus arrhizus]|nr:hypothetical protein G6F22_014339 [Rhizopus arrhizus]
MRVGHVGAGDQHGVRQLQAGIGVDVVGTGQRARQLVEDGIVLGQQLARQIEAHCVGAVGLDRLGQLFRRDIQGLPQRNIPHRLVARLAPLRRQHARAIAAHGVAQRQPFTAQLSMVGGMRFVAANPQHGAVPHLDAHAAARAAITAHRRHLGSGLGIHNGNPDD